MQAYISESIYRHILWYHPLWREYFEILCVYSGKFQDMVPIEFLTGFYVAQVVERGWDQFMALPWHDKIAMKVANFITGQVRTSKKQEFTVIYIHFSYFRINLQKTFAGPSSVT